MITSWDIYWITRLDGICISLAVLIFVIGAILFAIALVASMEGEWDQVKPKWMIRGCVLFVASLFLLAFIPSTKEVAAIYMIPKIVNNEQVQKLPDNAMKFLNRKLGEWIDDMTAKKKK